jgi:hypothetical protein
MSRYWVVRVAISVVLVALGQIATPFVGALVSDPTLRITIQVILVAPGLVAIILLASLSTRKPRR